MAFTQPYTNGALFSITLNDWGQKHKTYCYSRIPNTQIIERAVAEGTSKPQTLLEDLLELN